MKDLLLLSCVLLRVAMADSMEPVGRLINGVDIPQGSDYPFVLLREHDGGDVVCGGTLLNPSVIMTAAHCVPSVKIAESLGGERRQVASGMIHPDFDEDTLENDIALCFVDESFHEKRTVYADIPVRGSDFVRDLVILGGGIVEVRDGGRMASAVQSANIRVSACPRLYTDAYPYTCGLACGSFCAYGEDGRGNIMDACYGDSGGPALMVQGGDGDDVSYKVAGITSWGVDCGIGRDRPGVYVNVMRYSGWIHDSMCKDYRSYRDLYSREQGPFVGDGVIDGRDFAMQNLVRLDAVKLPKDACVGAPHRGSAPITP